MNLGHFVPSPSNAPHKTGTWKFIVIAAVIFLTVHQIVQQFDER